MEKATAELNDIKAASGSMLPEDRVARTMDLQEDIAAKIEIIKKNAEVEKGLLPQGDKVDKDAQAFKDELARITKYVTDLDANTKTECNNIPMMSSTGLSTGLVSRNSLPGCFKPRMLFESFVRHQIQQQIKSAISLYQISKLIVSSHISLTK